MGFQVLHPLGGLGCLCTLEIGGGSVLGTEKATILATYPMHMRSLESMNRYSGVPSVQVASSGGMPTDKSFEKQRHKPEAEDKS